VNKQNAMTIDPVMILFEDHHLIAVNKPAPLLTQAPAGLPSLESAVKEYIRVKYAKPAGVYLGIPHRLDRPVTGVVLFARNTKAAQRVHAQFAERRTKKVYWAAVDGEIEPEEGIWEDWVRKIPEEAKTVSAAEGEPGAKRAALSYRLLKRLIGGGSMLELSPITGRMHQLRVQCAWRGHPIIGDIAYGSSRPFGLISEHSRDQTIALHARQLTIEHPFTKNSLEITAPTPDTWGTEWS
jgi:23S rRNA pseudouridine1911/1915/1917 synthase